MRHSLRFACLCVADALLIALAWYWLGLPEPIPPAPLAPGEKLACVSYAPYHGSQSPFAKKLQLPPGQIADDLERLSKLTSCIRTYSAAKGLGQIPKFASQDGMQVLQGIWLGREPVANRREIESALRLAREYPGVIKAFIVGNEVLLRGEQSPAKLASYLREVRQRSGLPVTYADVWEYWLKAPELAADVDFVTIHILPYWEDKPVAAEDAVAHVKAIRAQVASVFPGKDILIGEVGWPSQGRMRAGALPSPANQARVLSGVVAAAKGEGWRVNLIEAFDQPWKRLLEGTVGGYWGLFDDARRAPKFEWGDPVSNFPNWRSVAASGIVASLYVLFAAWFGGRKLGPASLGRDLAAAAIALVTGLCFGWAASNLPMESVVFGDLIRGLVALVLALLVPALATLAIVRGDRLPGYEAPLDPISWRGADPVSQLLGLCFVAAAVIAMQVALGFVFDPRYKDFPLASLSPPVFALAVTVFAVRPMTDAACPGLAERTTALLLTGSACFIVANEGVLNWEALWLAVLLVVLALTALQARPARG